MLNGLPILIAEDEPMLGIDLANAIADLDGRAIGPVDTVVEALELLKSVTVRAAILDAHLRDRDITPLAVMLVNLSVPFVVYTGSGLPAELAEKHPHLPVVLKPTRSTTVLAALLQQVSPDRGRFAESRVDPSS